MTSHKKTTDALSILHRRYYKNNPERLAELEEAFVNDDVARKLSELRIGAGLSMRELADLVGTTASVICRLEDADYEGHSLSMLNRIAAALNMRVKVDFVPISIVPRDEGERLPRETHCPAMRWTNSLAA